MIAAITGCSLAEADEVRRALGSSEGQQPSVRELVLHRALRRGYDLVTVERVWEVLKAFASFGFCKAHAAAFALPTYQSAWLKAHHPAAFLAGVLTHDPGMYPSGSSSTTPGSSASRSSASTSTAPTPSTGWRRSRPGTSRRPSILGAPPRAVTSVPGTARRARLRHPARAVEVKGIAEAEVARIVAGRPYASLTDFWHRARVVAPGRRAAGGGRGLRLALRLSSVAPVRRRGQVTRRDLLLQVADLDRWSKPARRRAQPAQPGVASRRRRGRRTSQRRRPDSHRPRRVGRRASDVQLALQLFDDEAASTRDLGLPEMTTAERVRAELEVLGLDVSRHVVDFYSPMLDALGITRSPDLLRCRSQQEVLVAGVKVATQTPPIRSGRRVMFLTLDDSTGPVDATFFEDAQGPYCRDRLPLLAARGPRVRAPHRPARGVDAGDGCWEMSALFGAWEAGGIPAVLSVLADEPADGWGAATEESVTGAAESRSSRPVMAGVPGGGGGTRAGGMGQRRVLVHPSGFKQSPYADIKPAGEDTKKGTPRKLWHSSMGSPGA